ncbi:hypothetical protein POM88_044003 [Heracleum sosnowskyi]|uniref:26S proteasome complex subunit SEM1 n=1 Tax=Heracleum sosnowskyi TaxID=360622 RepID=A0AAD8H331_9APIA|nr:hypothetical protein POM88_044003 [Heracleum sosnowskyi]
MEEKISKEKVKIRGKEDKKIDIRECEEERERRYVWKKTEEQVVENIRNTVLRSKPNRCSLTCVHPPQSQINMDKESKVATEEPKIDLFEDDDEFEEFEINEEWDEKEGKEATQQWEDDWDDDDVSDDFSLQLRRELESNNVKS